MSWSRRDVRCSAVGCSTPLDPGRLYCKDHYFALPKALRDRLWSAWRAAMAKWRRAMTLDEEMRLSNAYQAAFQECQEYLRGAPTTPASAMSTVAIENGQPVAFVAGRLL